MTSSNATTEQVKLVLTVVSTFGLGSILLFIIGRLWTIAYFEHFGLSAADLEFSIEDFAFRSLEVLISLGLAGLGLLLAWHLKPTLQRFGPWVSVFAAFFVVGAVVLMLAGPLDWLVSQWPRLATITGVLGVISGGVLIVMILLVADIWFGSGESPKKPHDGENDGTLNAAIAWLKINWRKLACRETTPAPPDPGNPGTRREFIGWLTWNWHKPLAGFIMLGIVFLYLPLVTEELATIQAEIDLEKGRLPVAILETVKDPLPTVIASDADPNKSVAVRVILSQSQNTYVLNSTQCTAIGELETENGELKVEKTEEGLTFARPPDVCKVFAIPTARLKSIEYVQVDGSPPSNDIRFLAEEVDLAEPFSTTVSTKGASDDDDINCRGGKEAGFRNTAWYRFMPSTDGTVLATVKSDADLEPVVGIWEELEEGILAKRAARGSGPDGRACETNFQGRVISAKRVATIAKVQKEKHYLIAIGTQNDRGGALKISFEFAPGATFLFPKIPRDELPTITLPSIPGLVQMEVRDFDKTRFELVGSDDSPGEFSLVSEGNTVRFGEVEDQEDKTSRTLLETEKVLDPGTWMLLNVPKDFVGQVRLTTTKLPDVILAFADPSVPLLSDIRVQRALLLAIDEMSIRDSLGLGRVIFDRLSVDPGALTPEEGDDDVTRARELLEEAGVADELAVQIQPEPQSEEELDLLLAAAEILRQQLLGIGLDVTIEACKDVCIRVFVGSEAP